MSADLNLTKIINFKKWVGYFVKLIMNQIYTNGQKITLGRAMFKASLIFSRKHARLGNPPGCK